MVILNCIELYGIGLNGLEFELNWPELNCNHVYFSFRTDGIEIKLVCSRNGRDKEVNNQQFENYYENKMRRICKRQQR